MENLLTSCARFVAEHASIYAEEHLAGLPASLLEELLPFLSAASLHKLQQVYQSAGIDTSGTWLIHLKKRWHHRAAKRGSLFGDIDSDPRQVYLERHFHALLSEVCHVIIHNEAVQYTDCDTFNTCLHKLGCSPEDLGYEEINYTSDFDLLPFVDWVQRLSITSRQCKISLTSPSLMCHLIENVRRLYVELVLGRNYFKIRKFLHVLLAGKKLEHCSFEVKNNIDQFRDLMHMCSGQICKICFQENFIDFRKSVCKDDKDSKLTNILLQCQRSLPGHEELEKNLRDNVELRPKKKVTKRKLKKRREKELQRIYDKWHLSSSTSSSDFSSSSENSYHDDDRNYSEPDSYYHLEPHQLLALPNEDGCFETLPANTDSQSTQYSPTHNIGTVKEIDSDDDLYNMAVRPMESQPRSSWRNVLSILNRMRCGSIGGYLYGFRERDCFRCINKKYLRFVDVTWHSLSSLTLRNLNHEHSDEVLIEVLPEWLKLRKLALVHTALRSEYLADVLLYCISVGRLTHLVIDETYLCDNIMDFLVEAVTLSTCKSLNGGLDFLMLNNNMQVFNCSSLPQLEKISGLSNLDLSFNTFTSNGVNCLIEIFDKLESLTHIKLESCSLCEQYVARIVAKLADSGRCHYLNVSGNKVTGPAQDEVVRLVNNSPQLGHLNLSSAFLKSTFVCSEALTETLRNHPSLRTLEMANNRLGEVACIFLEKLYTPRIEKHGPIRVLDLSCSYYISKARLLQTGHHLRGVASIRRRPILTELRLSGNSLSVQSKKELAEAFRGVAQNLELKTQLSADCSFADHLSQM